MGNFLSASDLSKRYGVSKATIYNWLKTQNFPQGMKIERTRQWALDEILAWEAKKHD